jgi:flagellar hook-length control protein FliK
MDDEDKSIIEKTIERVKDIAAKASEKAHKAMEREPIKPGDEVVMMSEAAPIGDPVMPPFVIIPGRKKTPKQIAKKTAKRTAKRSFTKKSSKKKRKKRAAKPSKPVSKKAAKKKKKSKKSKR